MSAPSVPDSITPSYASFEELLSVLATNDELRHIELVPASLAAFSSPDYDLPAVVKERIPATQSLWTHQATAIDLALAGQSIVIATGTASGKSLCYQVPIATAAAETKGQATSLLLFPTKALAQDQLRSLGALGIKGLTPVTYDGDTTPDARQWARKHATAILTNPDMLHSGILPFHGRWATFLKRLRFVVIDELHTYRGIFGTHLAQILRRLRRLCAYYGSNPTFVFTSATIGQPEALASELAGASVVLVDNDGSPRGERVVAIWNPEVESDGIPVSGNSATGTILAALVAEGHRSIAFTRSRSGAELVAARAQRLVNDELAKTIRSYRGGYLATERREIERQLFSGELLGVAATNALELGVDIGGLDACICNGFPGTIASFRQQIGRAGRSAQRSLAVLVAGNDALDQWYAANPLELFRRPPEPVIINTANPFVLLPHLACAAHELPLVPADAETWARGTLSHTTADRAADRATGHDRLGTPDVFEAFDEGVQQLVHRDQLTLVNGRAVWSGRGSPAPRISLRSGGGAEYRIVDRRANLIGTVDGSRAFATLHEGALYLHQGQQYRVDRLDLSDHAAWVSPVSIDEYTQVKSDTDIRFLTTTMTRTLGRATLHIGDVEVTEQITGFQRKRISTGSVLANEELELPPSTLITRGFWYEFSDRVLSDAQLDGAQANQLPGALHAAEHCGIAMLPLFAVCDRWDVGGVSTAVHTQTGEATVVIYDGYPGGAGVAELGYEAGPRHLAATLAALRGCSCAKGCPSCVQSPKCGNGNEPLDKAAAIALLAAVLD